MERPFFPTEIEARRELTRVCLIHRDHYYPQKKINLMYLMTLIGNLKSKKNKVDSSSTDTDPLLSNMVAWFIIHMITIGYQMPQIILGLTVPVKVPNTNTTSSIQLDGHSNKQTSPSSLILLQNICITAKTVSNAILTEAIVNQITLLKPQDLGTTRPL